MIAIIDYDAGNMMSVFKAMKHLGEEPVITADATELESADKVILPGVGAFGDCMKKLEDRSLIPVIRKIIKDDRPFLGICLGLQLLFEGSEEAPEVAGIGALGGNIKRIPVGQYRKIPHMGWNSLSFPNRGRLFEGIDEGVYVYFVHSYYLEAKDRASVVATCDYNVTIDAAVEQGNVFATQFHPEKSGEAGLEILRNFIRL